MTRAAGHHLSAAQLEEVALRFRLLGEPVRLLLLQALMAGERSVGELVEALDMGQANVSKHLQLLLGHGLVARRKEGLFAIYRIADPTVFQLCELVCARLEQTSHARHQRLISPKRLAGRSAA